MKIKRGKLELDEDEEGGRWREIRGGVTAPIGFSAATTFSQLRSSKDRPDLTLIVSDAPCSAAGVFTKNAVCAAPVTYCRGALERTGNFGTRAVLVNAGQANAATGQGGWDDAVKSASAAASLLRCSPDEVLLMSTGVIGERIPLSMLKQGLAMFEDADQFGSGQVAGELSAAAITTTDLVFKDIAVEVALHDDGGGGGTTVRVGGMSKGSGMIHPNMATMLGLVTTDAAVAPALWQAIIRAAIENSFNQISVDGDTSTNDTVIGLSNGRSGAPVIADPNSPNALLLTHACTAVCQALAKAIAWDGEGATCLIECHVEGARSNADANTCARSVVSSSLVKSAVYGRDPNWGRIACAAGYSGVHVSQDALCIVLGEHILMAEGQPLDFDRAAASAYLSAEGERHGKVRMKVVIGDGPGYGIAWGCDLSEEYIRINAYYTT